MIKFLSSHNHRRRPRHLRRRNRAFGTVAALLAIGLAGLAGTTHIVAEGDSLWRLAKRYGTTVEAIDKANDLKSPDLVRIGERLRIPTAAQPTAGTPAAPAPAPQAPALADHSVKPGESLGKIAARYGTTVRELVELNKVPRANVIRAGQVLKVPVPGPPSVEQLLEGYSRQYGVDPALIKAIAWQESGWQQEVTSVLGAVGVMQVMPESGVFTGRHLLGSDVDLRNVEHNIKAGVRFLAYLLEKAGGDERLAVAGYYQGLRSVRANGMSEKTKRYVANVMALRDIFRSGKRPAR
ncbi:MAG: LysM peptidoglycan-binding domain-containing protein [Actinomycetota bacterium]